MIEQARSTHQGYVQELKHNLMEIASLAILMAWHVISHSKALLSQYQIRNLNETHFCSDHSHSLHKEKKHQCFLAVAVTVWCSSLNSLVFFS